MSNRSNRINFVYLIESLRPHQWTKNLVVFAAPLFAFNINWKSFQGALISFVLFCCISSACYLFNDIMDVESDRQHPTKSKRPIALGLVNIPIAIVIGLIILITSLIIGWQKSPMLGITFIGYTLLQIAYNLKLKRQPILDIFSIAGGFILRAYAGFAATNIALSSWFSLCTAMLALFLAVEKRKAELRLLAVQGSHTRTVLKRYSLPLLNRMESVVTSGAIMSYAIWSSGPQVNGASTPYMMITLPFVIYGIFRYQLLSEPNQKDSNIEESFDQDKDIERPEKILLTDLPILITVITWIITVFIILWLKDKGFIQ